jgi:hypothetical protein
MEKKRRQHYVFQAYLTSWATNQQVWCCRDGNIFKSNTINIAQERDFYRIKPLNDYELKFFLLFHKKSHPDVRKAMLDHINTYLSPLEWQKHIEQLEALSQLMPNKSKDQSFEIEKIIVDLKNKVDVSINNLMEDYLSDIEGESMKWIASLKESDCTFYYSSNDEKAKTQGYYDDDRFNFLYFVSIQYFRTKALKERWITNFKPALSHPQWNSLGIPKEHICLENLHSLFMWEFQNACAYGLRKKNAHLTILTNKTSIPFITSDQPVINLRADYQDLSNETTELVFYYPITPNIAITINDENTEDRANLSLQEVEYYNKAIVKSSHQNIFASNVEVINRYI